MPVIDYTEPLPSEEEMTAKMRRIYDRLKLRRKVLRKLEAFQEDVGGYWIRLITEYGFAGMKKQLREDMDWLERDIRLLRHEQKKKQRKEKRK